MVKRQTIKKEPKMKQKQKQQQNVVVNIGTVKPPPKKRKPRQTKPKPDDKPPAYISQGIITRGPNTFYQQPQPVPQPIQQPQAQTQTINEIFRAIQQQQQTNIPAAPTIGGTLLNPAPVNERRRAPALSEDVKTLFSSSPASTNLSIVPPAVVEAPARQVNDLEKVRKARVEKFQKPTLQTVFNIEPTGQEDEAYQNAQQYRDLTAQFRAAEKNEPNTSLLGEIRAEPKFTAAINLQPAKEITTEEAVKPNLSLQPSELVTPPTKRRQGALPHYKSALSALTGENREESGLFSELLTGSKKVNSLRSLTAELADKQKEIFPPNAAPFFLSEESPLSLLNVIEQSNEGGDILQGGDVPFEGDNTQAIAEEKFEGISELNLEDQRPAEPPPPLPAYQGGSFLPAIVQPPQNEPVLKQILTPTAEPSLAAAVRTGDEYTTERLVEGKKDGIPEAEARDVVQGNPTERLRALARELGVTISRDGRYFKAGEIERRIKVKMGEDYVIPDFKADAKKPGPRAKVVKAVKVNEDELVLEEA